MSNDAYVFHAGDDDEEDARTVTTAGLHHGGGDVDDVMDEKEDDNRTVATAAGTTITAAARKGLDVNQVPFHVVCTLMTRILSGGRKEKEKFLHNFWKTCYKPDVSMYPLMRLLLPQLDSDRPTYGLRESSLADAYIQALGLSKTLDQAMRLKNYKTPYKAGAGGHRPGDTSGSGVSGDFALVVADVLRRYVSVPEGSSKITIGDINHMLDQLASDKDKGSVVRTTVFTRCVSEMSPLENMWFTRIITKDLKMGMRHESMLKLFDPDALDIYNSCSSLKLVCEQVSHPGRQKVAFSAVNYFAPCKPMLASPPPWQSVVGRMKGNPFFIEPKFDGERLLLHKKDGVVKLFTRNSIDYTNRYNYGVSFTPIILQALGNHNCIIDGELLTWDTATQQYVKFGSNRTTAMSSNALGDTRQLCYMAFDVLRVDDEVLIDKPLTERREILHSLVRPIPQQFEVIKCRTDVTTSPGLLETLMENVAAGMEGVIVKNANSPYVLNDRSDNWIKVKPDYVDGLRDNMDLLLLGGYFGEGTRRTGGVSHFLLGVLEHKLTPAEIERAKDRTKLPPPCFTFCKVGSGYSIPRLKELRLGQAHQVHGVLFESMLLSVLTLTRICLVSSDSELASKFRPYDPKNQPKHFMDWRHEKSDIPDVWIDPRDSVIFELKCYEITACRPNKFSAGYTCRFPRVVQIRSDKDWTDCMTRDEMVALAEPAIRQSAGALADASGGAAASMAGGANAAAVRELPFGGLDEEDAAVKIEGRMKQEEEPRSPPHVDWRTEENLISPEPQHTTAAAAAAAPAWVPRMGLEGEMAEAERDGGGGGWHMGDDDGGGNMAAHAALMDGEAGGKKKGKKRKAKDESKKKMVIKKGTVVSLFQPTDVSNIGVLASNLFENKSFCVMSTDRTPNKAELERLIALNGGTFTQNPMPHTFCIIACWAESVKVDVQRKAKKKDIIHYSWLVDCVAQNRLLPLSKKYVISGTDATNRALEREVDSFGDSFTYATDTDTLMATLSECGAQYLHPYDGPAERPPAKRPKVPRALLEAELNLTKPPPPSYRSQFLAFTKEQQQSLLSPVRALMGYDVWVYGKQDSPGVRLGLITIQLLGGHISEVLHQHITHVLHITSTANSSATSSATSAMDVDDTFTLDALKAVLPGFGLTLNSSDGASAAAASLPPSGTCSLITLDWIEHQRQLQTELMDVR